jgi:hypothetical protein
VGDKLAVKMAEYAQQSLPGYFKRFELYKQHRPYHAPHPAGMRRKRIT